MLPPIVADINIAPTVIQFLRKRSVDVVSAREEGWSRYEDPDILREAYEMGRFVLTHDADFSKLAVFQNQAIRGIIYLRPGGRPPAEVITDLENLLKAQMDWTQRQIVVCEPDKPLRIRLIDN